TGAHLMHGELIALCVVAMSAWQGNMPDVARDVVVRGAVRANPLDLGIGREHFVAALVGLRDYVAAQKLDYSVVDERPISAADAARLWEIICALPRSVDRA